MVVPKYMSFLITVLHLCYSSPPSQFHNSKESRISSLDSIYHIDYNLFLDYVSLGRKYIISWFINFQCVNILVSIQIYLFCSRWTISHKGKGTSWSGTASWMRDPIWICPLTENRKRTWGIWKYICAVSFWFRVWEPACILRPNCQGSNEDYNEGESCLFIF